jgi:hypothetical protein
MIEYRGEGDLLWIAVDLDNTIAEGSWTPENPTSQIGSPIAVNVEKCRELVRHGYKIIIHTARGWTDYERIEVWCADNDIPVSHIVCGKLLAKRYVDDRNTDMNDASWLPKG